MYRKLIFCSDNWKIVLQFHDLMDDFREIDEISPTFGCPKKCQTLRIWTCYIILKHLTWIFRVYYLFWETLEFRDFMDKNNKK